MLASPIRLEDLLGRRPLAAADPIRSCSPAPLRPWPPQVGVEKEKVNAENEAAQVEADKCAGIAREVSEKQTVCERELAAAEPLVAQAEAALDTLNKKDLGEAKALKKPPAGGGAAPGC